MEDIYGSLWKIWGNNWSKKEPNLTFLRDQKNAAIYALTISSSFNVNMSASRFCQNCPHCYLQATFLSMFKYGNQNIYTLWNLAEVTSCYITITIIISHTTPQFSKVYSPAAIVSHTHEEGYSSSASKATKQVLPTNTLFQIRYGFDDNLWIFFFFFHFSMKIYIVPPH